MMRIDAYLARIQLGDTDAAYEAAMDGCLSPSEKAYIRLQARRRIDNESA